MIMANQEEQPAAIAQTSSPSASVELETYDDDHDYEEASAMSAACCSCFKGSVFWRRNNNGSGRYLLPKLQERTEYGFCMEKVKKLKEISEMLAGPRWKNFIRRFSTVHGINNKKRRMQCQYDHQSYVLNFDDGIDRETDDAYPDFLARYVAAPPVGIKLSFGLSTHCNLLV